MAGLLTPEERAAAASAMFGPGQPGPMAPGPSECGVFCYTRFFVCCCCLCMAGSLTWVVFFYVGSSSTSISGWEECYLGVLGDVGGGLRQSLYSL